MPNEPEPLHRQWLHALEADFSVPYYALQVARIYADFAARAPAAPVWVSWDTLRRCTHQRKDRLSQSLAWLRDNGWLKELPMKNRAGDLVESGTRKFHALTTPAYRTGPASGTTTGPASGTTTGPASGTTTGPASGTANVPHKGRENGARGAPRANGAVGRPPIEDQDPPRPPRCRECGFPLGADDPADVHERCG